MKTLLLMRHAKSSWKDTSLADHDRPLNKRGERDAPRMGEHLNQENQIPDVILCSSAKRARLTVDGLLETCHFDGEIFIHNELYHSGTRTYLALLSALPTAIETAMIVGHNPGMEMLLEMLTGEDERLPTAALALIQLSIENWAQLSDEAEGELLNLWLPRTLME